MPRGAISQLFVIKKYVRAYVLSKIDLTFVKKETSKKGTVMNKIAVLTESSYTTLVGDIRRLIDDGKERASRAASYELVRTYWEVGRRIADEKLTDNAGYNAAILKDLSEELGIDYGTLTRSLKFYQTYEVAPRGKNINWSHYKLLIPLSNPKERQWYESLVEEKSMTRQGLVEAMRNDAFEQQSKSKGKPVKPSKLKRPTEATYVYKAKVDRVIDGDSVPRKAAYEMRDGPSESTCRGRLQSALSGNGQNLLS